jgi:hypothetical protein
MSDTVRCGDGMTDEVRGALVAILRCVITTMFKAQEPWALMGSTASVLQGIDGYRPPDIDLTTTREGAYIMEGCVGNAGATERPVAYSERKPYASYFGIFEVAGVKVEVMGDLVIAVDDGVIDLKDHWSRWSDKVRLVRFEGYSIPVVPLEWQMIANVLLNRPERSGPIAAYLREHGFDRDHMLELLSDERLGARTITCVRKELHLDD